MLSADSSSPETLARRCLLAGFTGPRIPGWLADQLGAGLGGVVLFASNVVDHDQLSGLTAALRDAGTDVVIGMDEEGGEVTRLDAAGGSRVPGAAALGALDDVAATEAVYSTLGRRLAAAGVTVNLAPVADVNSDPRNPVIGVRAFGADPELVARHVAAAVRGIQGAGVAASAKHFPGHGDTTTDSHRAIAVIDHSRAQLDAVDLVPFRAAIAAGTRSIMTGHLLVRSLDELRPATLSPDVLTTLLRGELGFAGAVITDALEMKAIADGFSGAGLAGSARTRPPGPTVGGAYGAGLAGSARTRPPGPTVGGMVEGAVLALVAGADALCIGAREHDALYDEIPAAVGAAVAEGRLPLARLRDAADRTRALSVLDASSGVAALGPAGLAEIAARSLTVSGVLPTLHRPQLIEFHTANSEAAGALRWSLANRLHEVLPGAELVGDPTELSRQRDVVVVVRDQVRHPEQAALLTALAAAHHGAVVVADVGWPGPTDHGLPTVHTHGISPPLLDAAAHLIGRDRGVAR
ncbi:MAG: glycoside hydrolase family 3 protein [Jatrophihabitans sp.]